MRLIQGARYVVHAALFALTSLVLLASLYLLVVQTYWDPPQSLEPQAAFMGGSIGTEIMPLPVFIALPMLFPEEFHPLGTNRWPWYEQFGMNMQIPSEHGLPTGFYVSNKRPQSGAPSPVPFVGIACVMCHSNEIRLPSGEVRHIIGASNSSLNLFAWLDAFQFAVLDEQRLNLEEICRVYQEQTGEAVGWQQQLMIDLWLRGIRRRVQEGTTRFGDPYHGSDVLDPEFVPTGPGRTQPFRTLVRRLLNRPGTDMAVYTKVATVFWEDRREWAQVDGSIRDLNSRSSLAAYAAGATIQNMRHPEIVHNIRRASDFTRALDAPSYYSVFPARASQRDADLEQLGRQVYIRSCASCHGVPDGERGWRALSASEQPADLAAYEKLGEVVPYDKIGTDPERVTFRRFHELPDLAFAAFPNDHPFKFARREIRPGPAGTTQGYINTPLERVYARAPYLHNASVLTLAELIHLVKRRTVFYRGNNEFDPEWVGLKSPDQQPEELTPTAYFRFDTSRRGNSNRGHDYPWPYDSADRDVDALRALLAFLKTL